VTLHKLHTNIIINLIKELSKQIMHNIVTLILYHDHYNYYHYYHYYYDYFIIILLLLPKQCGRVTERSPRNSNVTSSKTDDGNSRSYCFGAQEGLWNTTCAHLICHNLDRWHLKILIIIMCHRLGPALGLDTVVINEVFSTIYCCKKTMIFTSLTWTELVVCSVLCSFLHA